MKPANTIFNSYFTNSIQLKLPGLSLLFIVLILDVSQIAHAQIVDADRSGFTWISKENVPDDSFGYGFTLYSAAWPTYAKYPGSSGYQMGLAGGWLSTQRTGNEPDQFYTTIEGGLGWWGDTRFGKEVPKFIMGGVSHDFYSWANGTGAGRSDNLPNGQRDWSTPGGKYGVAQLSNRLLWAPDGLNMAQALNGELLGYGYTPLPITDPITQTAGTNIETGNQCWTLFLNTTNFKGPATFFLPTFWTEPVLEDPSLEGFYLDSRPSDPNFGLGLEHADTPALISEDSNGNLFAKTAAMQFPLSGENNSILMNRVSVYSDDAIWKDMESWFNGGSPVAPGLNQLGIRDVPFINNGGSLVGEIAERGQNATSYDMDLEFMDNVQLNSLTMGYTFDLNMVKRNKNNFSLSEYYKLNIQERWEAIEEQDIPVSSYLINTPVPTNPRPEIPYLTPREPDCQFQDPNGPWNNPGPTAGPFTADLGDGSTLTYYWYRFIDQPAIIHANYSEEMREKMQERVELIHTNWRHTDDYIPSPSVGNLATLDPEIIVQPPAGLEIGYVPIVTRQEKSRSKLRIFILAGQSNMEGYGTVNDIENDPGSLVYVIENDIDGEWSDIGPVDNWNTLDDAYLYFEGFNGTISTNVTVGQGANSGLIGPELMFAHQLDKYYDDPILIIKTAWGGKSLAEDFRPPSSGGTPGPYYTMMLDRINYVTSNLANEFPSIDVDEMEISGFAWFQGWNDGASDEFLNDYESNLTNLIHDLRTDLGVPDLPFVVASSGHGGYNATGDGWVSSMQEIVSVAQETVGCDDETYGGSVGFVDTKQYYRALEESPENAIHHFHNNALTFLNIGNAIGKEMILAINDMAYCYLDCGENLVAADLTSIGNRVWNDYNRNGINEPNEPGIPSVSVVLWSDPDGDGIPDWQGFMGVQVTDAEGYYRFSGLEPGNYVVFIWQVDNWDVGEPLHGFVSSDIFEADANNDVDFDNNGSGPAFSDIFSGIVSLTVDGEPLNDGDPESCIFDFDAAGNNSVDFGFYDPSAQIDFDGDGFFAWEDCDDENPDVNPEQIEEPYNGLDDDCNEETLDDDLDQDGFVEVDDCDDSNPEINPDAIEIPNNGIDEDCDGMDQTTGTYTFLNNQIKLYPNPANSFIYIELIGNLDYEVSLYNIQGNQLLSKTNVTMLPIHKLNSGMYLLELTDRHSGERLVARIIKN